MFMNISNFTFMFKLNFLVVYILSFCFISVNIAVCIVIHKINFHSFYAYK